MSELLAICPEIINLLEEFVRERTEPIYTSPGRPFHHLGVNATCLSLSKASLNYPMKVICQIKQVQIRPQVGFFLDSKKMATTPERPELYVKNHYDKYRTQKGRSTSALLYVRYVLAVQDTSHLLARQFEQIEKYSPRCIYYMSNPSDGLQAEKITLLQQFSTGHISKMRSQHSIWNTENRIQACSLGLGMINSPSLTWLGYGSGGQHTATKRFSYGMCCTYDTIQFRINVSWVVGQIHKPRKGGISYDTTTLMRFET